MMDKQPVVAFIGLGAMGFGMATNLVREGFSVTGFDIYEPIRERFRQAGGLIAATPAAAVDGKPYCVCMVATAQQAQSVLFEGTASTIDAIPREAVLLLCSTVPSHYAKGLQQELRDRGRGDIALIDCPVSGGATRAANGTLSIMASALDESIEKGRHLLQAMSDPAKLYIVKGGIGAGSNMKMCHQVLAAVQILSASEAMGLANLLSLDPFKTGEAIIRSSAWSWMFEDRLPRMLDRHFQPLASALYIILKDTNIITSEGRRAGFPLPMTTVAEQVYFWGLSRGFGADDDSSLIRLYNERKGNVGSVADLVHNEDAKLALVVNLLRGIHLCAAAEALAFAYHVGLDLDQVFELCINAAGGSKMLSTLGPEMMDVLREGGAQGERIGSKHGPLQTMRDELQQAVDEAQKLKMPIFLGSQALNLIEFALSSRSQGVSAVAVEDVVSVWTGSGSGR